MSSLLRDKNPQEQSILLALLHEGCLQGAGETSGIGVSMSMYFEDSQSAQHQAPGTLFTYSASTCVLWKLVHHTLSEERFLEIADSSINGARNSLPLCTH